ncbi:hypothetical protein PGTUg99_015357 [Puccinia graminis f. sp. tritici]|uniref:Uncharacterized protein n=1 Tax=Puccinia graminis f. sp. tritici TaxID=56615 RepID=A0A5B0MCC9_PUCGR|nr:hypothetical protein PGTUg99_015357 [Puccinia graminis f. sp. tritici]
MPRPPPTSSPLSTVLPSDPPNICTAEPNVVPIVVLCPTASRFLIKAKLPSTSSSSRQVLSNFLTVFRRYLHSDPPRFYTGKPRLPYFNWQQTVINDFDIDGLDAIPRLPSVFLDPSIFLNSRWFCVCTTAVINKSAGSDANCLLSSACPISTAHPSSPLSSSASSAPSSSPRSLR